MAESKPKVLFLCTGNSCRSQMAEGLLRHLGGSRFEAVSAGTRPVGLNPGAVAVMDELGIDISGHTSKHVDSLAGEDFRHVITVCDNARETCPVFPAAVNTLHWSFDDPAGASGTQEERMAVFRRVRDEIRARIQKFLDDSAVPAG
jgi:arsenate reductase